MACLNLSAAKLDLLLCRTAVASSSCERSVKMEYTVGNRDTLDLGFGSSIFVRLTWHFKVWFHHPAQTLKI